LEAPLWYSLVMASVTYRSRTSQGHVHILYCMTFMENFQLQLDAECVEISEI